MRATSNTHTHETSPHITPATPRSRHAVAPDDAPTYPVLCGILFKRRQGNRISARFEYEWYDDAGQWYRTHGNEHWEFDERGYMRWRDMSANDVPIDESERRL